MQYGEPTQNASAFSFVPGTYEATGLPWKAKTSCRADRVSVRHDRIPVVRCRLPETSSPDGPFLRGAPVFAVRFGLAAAFVSPMPSDLSVGRFAAGRGSVRRFGSRQETLVDISYRSAGWGRLFENRSDASGFCAGGPRATVGRRPAGCPCEGRCRLPRAMTLRANFRAGQRSRRIRLLVLSLCSTTGAEYPNGSYSAAIRPPRRMPCVRHR